MDKEPDFILSVGNPNGDEKAIYEGYVNGFVWEHGNIEDHDFVENDFHFGGHVWGNWDHFAVRGWVTDFDLDGPAQVLINGENVRAQDVPDYRPARFSDTGGGGGNRDRSDRGGGDSTPDRRNTGGSDGANRSGSAIADGGAYVVSPGDLQNALADLHEDSGDGPGNERRSYATLEPGATFDPGETVHIPRNMVVDASGASIVPSASYDLFTFDLGSVLVRPYVNLRGVGDGNSYDARVFTFDPANVTYGADNTKRNRGYVDKDAWKPRDGQPFNKYRFAEHERQNFFGNGSGVVGGSTLANPRDYSTLFYFHQDREHDGWNSSCLALFEVSHSARGVAYPVDIYSEGSKGFINDVVVKGYYVGWRVGITIRGNETARKNRFEMDMQPESGLSKHMMVYDNPTTQRNLFRGCSWDAQKASGPMWLIKRATGQNVLQSLTGHGENIMRDHTGGPNKVTNPF
jgi:hypothetical protein